MSIYQYVTFETKGTVSEFEVDGEIVETYTPRPYNSGFVALVKRPDSRNEPQTDVDVSERVNEDTENGEQTCSGKDGDCSRTVSDDEETCWQH